MRSFASISFAKCDSGIFGIGPLALHAESTNTSGKSSERIGADCRLFPMSATGWDALIRGQALLESSNVSPFPPLTPPSPILSAVRTPYGAFDP